MRRLLTFFLFLCFLLLGGIPSACAGKSYSPSRLPVHHQSKTGVIKQTGDHPSPLLSGYRDLPEDSDLPLLAEDDDDQEDITKKAKPSIEGFAIPFAFVSGASPSHLTNYLFFHHRAYTNYCKYILQRALRI